MKTATQVLSELGEEVEAELRFALEHAHRDPAGAYKIIRGVAKRFGKKNRDEKIAALLKEVERRMKGGR